MNKKAFIRNTCWLTLEATALRLSGIWFKGWVCDELGDVQMGIYQLIFSVFSLGVVVSASGANFAATRLTAEHGPNRRTLRRCLALSLAVSLVAGIALYFGAPLLAETLGGTTPLRVLIPGLPCIAASATLKGCFVAEGHTGAPMIAELLEQAAGITLSILLIHWIHNSLTALMLASTLAEMFSCLFMVLAYALRYGSHKVNKSEIPVPWKEPVRIGGPVMGGTGLRSLLFSVENLLIPRGLAAQYGYTGALAQYGMMHGMVLPVLQFPSAALFAAVTLLVPELARCCTRQLHTRIQLVAGSAFRLTLCFSFAVAACIAAFSAPLCRLFYGSTEAAWLLRIMAPLVPLMYVDSVVDGMLKGLDQQSYSLFYNIADSCMRVTWCAFILPHLGLMGYVMLLFLSEIFNAALSISRLLKVAELEISPVWVLLPACGAALLYAILTFLFP